MGRSTGRPGFTLIELLVVIAIIAILAAILFPVFITAKKKAQMVQCSSNMKQITSAALMYAENNDGWLPPYKSAKSADDWAWGFWHQVLKPYVARRIGTDYKDVSPVFQCPSVPTKVVTGEMIASIGWNIFPVYSETKPMRLSEYRSTTNTILIGDNSVSPRGVGPSWYFWAYLVPPHQKLPGSKLTDRQANQEKHNGCKDIGWVDGHVGTKSLNDLEANYKKTPPNWWRDVSWSVNR